MGRVGVSATRGLWAGACCVGDAGAGVLGGVAATFFLAHPEPKKAIAAKLTVATAKRFFTGTASLAIVIAHFAAIRHPVGTGFGIVERPITFASGPAVHGSSVFNRCTFHVIDYDDYGGYFLRLQAQAELFLKRIGKGGNLIDGGDGLAWTRRVAGGGGSLFSGPS